MGTNEPTPEARFLAAIFGSETTETKKSKERDPDALIRLRKEMAELLKVLNPCEARTINLRFGLSKGDTPRTIEEVGALFNISSDRVREIESRAIEKLRQRRKASSDE